MWARRSSLQTRLVVLGTRRHVIEFPTKPPGRLEITEDGSPTGRRGHVDAVRDSRHAGLHEHADAAWGARTVPLEVLYFCPKDFVDDTL